MMQKKLSFSLALLFIAFLFNSYSYADDTFYRLVISRNDTTVDGRYYLDVEMRVTNGIARELNSLTIDINYDNTLTAWTSDPDTNWFQPNAGYVKSVSKLNGYYRILVTGDYDAIGSGNTWSVTNSWQKVVTLRFKIASVTSHDCSIASTTDAAAYFTSPSSVSEWAVSNANESNLLVQTKVFLEGPYDTGTHQMGTALRTSGYIPRTSPYNEDPRTLASVPTDVTDWVLVQIRSQATGSAVASKSALLKKDGQIVADDGTTSQIHLDEIAGNYYIIIKHRNHLSVMSKNTWTLSSTSTSLYDFTTGVGQYYGDDAKQLESGVYGMYTGDANGNGQVQNDDKNDYWKVQVGLAGYRSADFNLNGQVQNDDKNDFWKSNVGKGTQVP